MSEEQTLEEILIDLKNQKFYGEITLKVEEGEPTRMLEKVRSIKLKIK